MLYHLKKNYKFSVGWIWGTLLKDLLTSAIIMNRIFLGGTLRDS